MTYDEATAGPLIAALMANQQDLAGYIDRHLPAALRATVEPADVLHDVCCEALRREAEFVPQDPSSGRRWLYTIARRRMVRLLERHAAGRTAIADDPVVLLLEELAVYLRTPSQSAASHETWAIVQRSLDRLRPAHSDVLRARYLDRRSVADVAGSTGRTSHAVEQLCHRAMEALRLDLRKLIAAHV